MNVCPEEIRTINRRHELSRIRKTREYRDIVESLTRGHTCIWCGRSDRLTIHHVSLQDYVSERAYIDGLYRGWVMCTTCHRAYHMGKILCPKCKERYTKYATCYQCMPQMQKDEIERKKAQFKRIRRDIQRARYQKYKEWKDANR